MVSWAAASTSSHEPPDARPGAAAQATNVASTSLKSPDGTVSSPVAGVANYNDGLEAHSGGARPALPTFSREPRARRARTYLTDHRGAEFSFSWPYNTERLHRSFGLSFPVSTPVPTVDEPSVLRRKGVLGGLLHEYHRVGA